MVKLTESTLRNIIKQQLRKTLKETNGGASLNLGADMPHRKIEQFLDSQSQSEVSLEAIVEATNMSANDVVGILYDQEYEGMYAIVVRKLDTQDEMY
jgi:hypothetical protein